MPSHALGRLLEPDPRVRILVGGDPDRDGYCILYWMQRAQRGRQNLALNHAVELGNALGKPVLAAFGLTADYPSAQRRHYAFLLDAFAELRDDLEAKGIPLVLRIGRPDEVVLGLAREVCPAVVIGDENPVRVGQAWRLRVAEGLGRPLRLVDADVVVPTSLFPKQEYAARTIRPKIHRVLGEYLRPIPEPRAKVAWEPAAIPRGEEIDRDALLAKLRVRGVGEVPGYRGGTAEALRRLRRFLKDRLPDYSDRRNEPTPYRTSELSAHLHFGHISPLTVALAVRDSGEAPGDVEAYLEELIVRRELAINFVARNEDYDRLSGCPAWALQTLAKHAGDRRPALYTAAQLEAGETADPLWNAAQKEMVLTGRMHNYLRMYWAKQLLRWTPDPETAFDIAVELNDRYEMDGRDPNGYAGVAWAIGGLHDRPWPERPIFGTVRTMTDAGLRRKIDAEAYVARVRDIERGGPEG